MQKTKIEWTDYVWNPIKGLCPNKCWYCYARRIYQRFKWDPEMHFELHDPMSIDRLYKKNIPDGSRVFVCSTYELFHPEVPKSWRKIIFDVIKLNQKHTFQILTKFPQKIDRPMPDNVWLGVTIESSSEIERSYELLKKEARIKFMSLEPLFGWLSKGELDHIQCLDWIIVGRLTQHGNDYDPARFWIEEIVDVCKKYGKPVFLKNNLKDIWKGPLIQEFPECS